MSKLLPIHHQLKDSDILCWMKASKKMKSLSTSAAVQVGSDTVEVFALVGKSVER